MIVGLIFIIFVIGVIIYCLYRVHSKIVFKKYEPFCPSCDKKFDSEYTYYIYCPNCHTKIIWRNNNPTDLNKKLKEYREKRRRDNV